MSEEIPHGKRRRRTPASHPFAPGVSNCYRRMFLLIVPFADNSNGVARFQITIKNWGPRDANKHDDSRGDR
jgi:hypothetical protein